jgi:hypothetical protein
VEPLFDRRTHPRRRAGCVTSRVLTPYSRANCSRMPSGVEGEPGRQRLALTLNCGDGHPAFLETYSAAITRVPSAFSSCTTVKPSNSGWPR